MAKEVCQCQSAVNACYGPVAVLTVPAGKFVAVLPREPCGCMFGDVQVEWEKEDRFLSGVKAWRKAGGLSLVPEK